MQVRHRHSMAAVFATSVAPRPSELWEGILRLQRPLAHNIQEGRQILGRKCRLQPMRRLVGSVEKWQGRVGGVRRLALEAAQSTPQN